MNKNIFHYIALIAALLWATLFAAHAQIQRPISGVVAATTSPVTIRYLEPDGSSIGRTAGIGDPIYLNDEIITDAQTSMQILLKDQTVFTIGPNSVLVFDTFIYDPSDASTQSSLSATVKKGTFKFISGRISKSGPEAMKLRVANATASIRGTSVAGRVDEEGDADVVLLSGAISVQSAGDAAPVDVFQPGWGLNIAADGFAGAPVLFSAEQIDSIVSTVEFSAAVNTASTADADESEGDGEQGSDDTEEAQGGAGEDGVQTAALTDQAPALSITEVTEVGQIADALASELTVDAGGSYNSTDIIALLLTNDNIAELFGNIDDIEDAAFSNVNVEAQLLQYLVTGGQPLWLQIGNDGSAGNTLPTDDAITLRNSAIERALYGYASADDVPDLVMKVGPPQVFNYSNVVNGPLLSSVYSGSVRYVKTGLALTPDQNSPVGGSGTAGYDVTLTYATSNITGSFTVNDLVINSVNYTDKTMSITSPTLNGQPLAVSDTLNGVRLVTSAMTPVNPGDAAAAVSLDADFGSIVDFSESESGSSSVDGALGGFRVQAYVTNDPQVESTSMLRAEQFQVGTVTP